ncbi:MAG: PhnD/SsuA/transferrin family substrate-binding protein [Kiritimatiellae bacterium]|nr:PhnD/SsuA/transferrin family substrate-binding protein [Kiritimatiellia bacterium]
MVVVALVTLPGLVLAGPASVPTGDDASPRAYRVGVLARRGKAHCLDTWRTTADYLSAQIPHTAFVIVPLGYAEIEPAAVAGELDFVLTNPAQYIALEMQHGANRLVTLKTLCRQMPVTQSGGVIFCAAANADIQSPADLGGKRFVAVEETSLSGWLAAHREFKDEGLDPRKDFASLGFAGTPDAVVEAVRYGTADAGVVPTAVWEEMAAADFLKPAEFRIVRSRTAEAVTSAFPCLCSTRLYPEWPLATLDHVPSPLAEKVAVALIAMTADSPAARAAGCAGWTVPLNYEPVRECLRELRLGPYQDLGQVTVRDVLRKYWPWAGGIVVFGLLGVTMAAVVSRLNRKLRASVAQQRELEGTILQVESNERQRIGRDLHDELGQILTAIGFEARKLELDLQDLQSFEGAESAKRITGQIEQAIGLVRRLARGMSLLALDSQCITPALNELARHTTDTFGLDCIFVGNEPDGTLSSMASSQFYRIAQEAVNNAVKHARAGNITIRLEPHEEGTLLAVSDDGTGMTGKSGGGIGIEVMRHRAHLIGADLQIGSKPGTGTVVRCFLSRAASAAGSERT